MYIPNSAKGSQKPMKKEMNIPTPKHKNPQIWAYPQKITGSRLTGTKEREVRQAYQNNEILPKFSKIQSKLGSKRKEFGIKTCDFTHRRRQIEQSRSPGARHPRGACAYEHPQITPNREGDRTASMAKVATLGESGRPREARAHPRTLTRRLKERCRKSW